MVVTFEIAPPFRLVPKVEKIGPLTRLIWAWFSVAYISGKFGSVWDAFRDDERERCAELAEDATQYTQFQTIEHYKNAAFIAGAIRECSNVEFRGGAAFAPSAGTPRYASGGGEE